MAGEVTQFQAYGPGGFFEIPDKVGGDVDKSASDSIVLVLAESPITRDTTVYDYIRLFVAESRLLVVIPPIPQETITLRLADVAQPPIALGVPQPKSATDNVILRITEGTSDIVTAIGGTESIVLVLSDVASIAVSLAEISASDSIVPVIAESSSIAITLDGTDSIVLILDEAADTPVEEPTIDEIDTTDSIIPVITEGAGDIAVALDGTDSVVLVIAEATAGIPIDVEPVAIEGDDSIILVLDAGFISIVQIEPFLELEVDDEIRLLLNETDTVRELGTDVDRITINLRPCGFIKVSLT
jgi:hypothetical protein